MNAAFIALGGANSGVTAMAGLYGSSQYSSAHEFEDFSNAQMVIGFCMALALIAIAILNIYCMKIPA